MTPGRTPCWPSRDGSGSERRLAFSHSSHAGREGRVPTACHTSPSRHCRPRGRPPVRHRAWPPHPCSCPERTASGHETRAASRRWGATRSPSIPTISSRQARPSRFTPECSPLTPRRSRCRVCPCSIPSAEQGAEPICRGHGSNSRLESFSDRQEQAAARNVQ